MTKKKLSGIDWFKVKYGDEIPAFQIPIQGNRKCKMGLPVDPLFTAPEYGMIQLPAGQVGSYQFDYSALTATVEIRVVGNKEHLCSYTLDINQHGKIMAVKLEYRKDPERPWWLT